jgi:dihydrofolate reductase
VGAGDTDMSDFEAAIRRQREDADALLLGRVTFEELRGYWPLQVDDTTGNAKYLNDVNKYVVTRILNDPEWDRSILLRGPLIEDVRRLKAEPGRDTVTTGSITVVHELISAGLVDEYRLFTYTTVLGHGRRLFDRQPRTRDLNLVEARSFRSGIVLLRYRP